MTPLEWAILVIVVVFLVPLLVLCLPAANVSGKCSEEERGK